jgi:hypothetical protein
MTSDPCFFAIGLNWKFGSVARIAKYGGNELRATDSKEGKLPIFSASVGDSKYGEIIGLGATCTSAVFEKYHLQRVDRNWGSVLAPPFSTSSRLRTSPTSPKFLTISPIHAVIMVCEQIRHEAPRLRCRGNGKFEMIFWSIWNSDVLRVIW